MNQKHTMNDVADRPITVETAEKNEQNNSNDLKSQNSRPLESPQQKQPTEGQGQQAKSPSSRDQEEPESVAIPQGNMEALQRLSRARSHVSKFVLEDYIQARKTGFFIFSKSYSTQDLMKWSKRAIPDGALLELDEDDDLIELASKCFEDLQRIMGDRKVAATGKKKNAERIQSLIEKGLFHNKLRDELYLQLIKQLTDNPSNESKLRGWEMMCCYSVTFPPSIRMDKWVLDFINKHAHSSDLGNCEKIKKMAEYSGKKLKRLCQVGPKGHIPSIPEIERAIIAPFNPSPFGETLEEIMKHPELRDESGRYPRILIFLSEAVLQLGGCSTEGIFRVPGDIEGVTALKLRIENGDYSCEENLRDPSIPASLLKLWLRELAEPLIPPDFYEAAIRTPFDKPDQAVAVLDRLPETNLLVAKYLVKFLQLIGDPRYQPVTKMTVSNLAMVFAPSFLRCPSDNPLTILANSRLEQAYIKMLINYLEE